MTAGASCIVVPQRTGRARAPVHALADQEKIGARDGCNVEFRLAAGGGESLQCTRKLFQRTENGIFTEIGEGEAHVVGMMEWIAGNWAALKAMNQFPVALLCSRRVSHGATHALCSLPGRYGPRGRRVDNEIANVEHAVKQVDN